MAVLPRLVAFAILTSMITPATAADEIPGLQIGERLTLFTTFELEWNKDRFKFDGTDDTESVSDQNHSLDVEAEIDLTDAFAAFVSLNIDLNEDLGEFDEYGVVWGGDDLEISLGLQSLPVLALESTLISDPLTTFNEITDESLILDYALSDRLELSAGVYTGGGDDVPDRGDGTDWVAALGFAATESLELTLGYQSDIADGDFYLAEDADSGRVPALNAGLRFSYEDWEIAALVVKATRAIPGAAGSLDRPSAAAVELRWAPREKLELALRAERSRELPDEPERRLGAGATWFFHPNAAVALEYSSLRFAEPASDEQDDEDDLFASRSSQWRLQLTFRF